MQKRLKKLEDYYANKTALVTGASSGIGKATAELLAGLGCNVLLVARNQGALEKTRGELEKLKTQPAQKFEIFAADLRNYEKLHETAEKILAKHQIDILFNNAGVYYTDYFENQSPEQIQNMVLTNLMAPLLLTRIFIPHFLKNSSGQVVNVSSLAAKLNFTGYGVYGGTKAGLSHSSKGLNFEYSHKNIFFSDFFAPDALTPGYEEELKNMPAETKKINGTVKPMASKDVALLLLEGTARRKLEIIPGFKSKAISFLAKHLHPSFVAKILHLLAK